MPINVYTGLMRSGKSYEVVSQVIIEAIAQGRRVVTNVDGISNDLVRQYVADKKKIDIEKLGNVFHVKNEDVFKPDFFPYFDDGHGEHIDTLVLPGDLVCIDEAWRFWGTDCKIHKNHKSFFLEHGHFTHPETKVACDLVLMIQDMGTLNRFVKAVVAFNFRTHKKVSLGMGNTYSVVMWEGCKQTKATQIGSWVRRYQKDIFPLYSSFKDGASGKTVNVDSRQNIFANKRLWVFLGVAVVAAFLSYRSIEGFLNPKNNKLVAESNSSNLTKPSSVSARNLSAPSFSSDWRYAGAVFTLSNSYAVLVSQNGQIRLVPSAAFIGNGLNAVGMVDGEAVTAFSGGPSGNFLSPTVPAPAPAAAERK